MPKERRAAAAAPRPRYGGGLAVQPGAFSGERGPQTGLRAPEYGVHAPLAQPGAEEHLPRWGQRGRDLLVVRTVGRKREVVKERERLRTKRREVGRQDPGRQLVSEAVQGLLV